jgi:hypothetical protein
VSRKQNAEMRAPKRFSPLVASTCRYPVFPLSDRTMRERVFLFEASRAFGPPRKSERLKLRPQEISDTADNGEQHQRVKKSREM